jgi:hypothetical protein
MSRPLVEHAGCDLNADEVRRWVCGRGYVPAQQTLGRVTAVWQVADPPTQLVVSHPRSPGLLAVLLGSPPAGGEPERYAVRLLTRRPDGGPGRWWFLCPRCGRRCGRLYLPAGAARVGCRRCFGLLYRSQFSRSHLRTNAPRRPRR